MSNNRQLALLVTLVAVATIVTSTIVSSTSHATPPVATPLTSCQASGKLNDYQLNECLIARVAIIRAELNAALTREEHRLISSTLRQATGVVVAAQHSFDRYVRLECLAEANPYAGGTIYPIVFGFCEVSLLQQRLKLVDFESTHSLAN